MAGKISIIIPTLGRKEELNNLFNSIQNTEFPVSNIVVVDQNGSDLIDDVIKAYNDRFNIIHEKVNFKGAARARNYGLQYADGEYLCFPDDDAEFCIDTFEIAFELIEREMVDVIFGKCVDKNNNNTVLAFSNQEGYLSLKKHEGMFVESTLFIKKSLFEKYKFDESLGVGTFHGAEEGYDLVLNLLNDNVKIFYSPRIQFYHPSKIIEHNNPVEIKRVFTYRCGFSRLCAKHKLYMKWLKRFAKVSLYIPYLLIIQRKKVRYYMAEWLGLLTGLVVR